MLTRTFSLLPTKAGLTHSCLGINAESLSPYLFMSGTDPAMVMKNIKSLTAIKLIDAIINNSRESRKDWLLNLFEKYGRENKSNYRYQFWQHENHPVLLQGADMFRQ